MNMLTRDLARMGIASDGASTMPVRGMIKDPLVIADLDFRATHSGLSRAEYATMRREQDREDSDAAAMSEWVRGKIGGGLADWKRACDALRDEIEKLDAGRERLTKHVTAPAETERTLKESIAAGAARMLAAIGIGTAEPEPETPAVSPEQLAARLEAERRAAAEATAALEIVELQIGEKQKHLDALLARADEVVNPALTDLAGPLGTRFVKQLADLRETASLMYALGDMLGTGYGTGWENFSRVTFARPGLPTTKLCPDERFTIGKPTDTDKAFWKNARNTLLANPDARVSLPIR
jgi:hypothetical protein